VNQTSFITSLNFWRNS